MPAGSDIVTSEDNEAEDSSVTYHLLHLGVPPRTGPRYHLLVPDDMVRYESIFLTAVRALLDVDAATRSAVTCRNSLCELTSLDKAIES